MMPSSCRGDLIARERRGLLSPAEKASVEGHLESCAECRSTRELGADFDAIGALRTGDEARVARIALAVANQGRRGSVVRRSAMRHSVAFWLAACALLAAGAAGAWGLWKRPALPRLSPVIAPGVLAAKKVPAPVEDPPRTSSKQLAPAREAPASVATQAEASTASVPAAPVAASQAELATAAQLFALANDAGREGHAARAVSFYLKLEQQFPGSREAQPARVSLGRLLLEQGSAAAALTQFDRYLAASGSSLSAEALYGRARALRALRRPREERAAWQRLLAEQPGSVYAATAKTRLGGLPSDG